MVVNHHFHRFQIHLPNRKPIVPVTLLPFVADTPVPTKSILETSVVKLLPSSFIVIGLGQSTQSTTITYE